MFIRPDSRHLKHIHIIAVAHFGKQALVQAFNKTIQGFVRANHGKWHNHQGRALFGFGELRGWLCIRLYFGRKNLPGELFRSMVRRLHSADNNNLVAALV